MPDVARVRREVAEEGAGDVVVPLPALLKGRLVYPEVPAAAELNELLSPAEGDVFRPASRPIVTDRCYVVALPAEQPSTQRRRRCVVVFPRINPSSLLEPDYDGLVGELFNLPFEEVLDFMARLARVIADRQSWSRAAAEFMRGIPGFDPSDVELAVTTLPHLLRPGSIREALERELGDAGASYLDGWVPVETTVEPGASARTAELVRPREDPGPTERHPRLRAMPTRQLHITAGNSVMTPLISLVRAFATKGAATVKTTVATAPAMTVVAHALREAGAEHPLVRHTSIVYWPGGDERVEDVLFARGSFDRLVAWGSERTLASITERARTSKLTLFRPRVGMTLVGRETFEADLDDVAASAVTDVMIDNQHACSSSLVHYVEGEEEQVVAYCRAVQHALASWERAAPVMVSRADVASLRSLRRGELAQARWFENFSGGVVSSAVAYTSQEVDLAGHPMCRLVIVRRVSDLEDALRYVNDAVAAVGVHPEARRLELRDRLAARGVSNVCPLGHCDRAYAGIPHDGVRPLHDLVNWISE